MNEVKKLAIIDAESIVYIIAYKYRELAESEFLIQSTDNFIESILSAVKATHYIGILGYKENNNVKKDNFRNRIYPEYKNRRLKKPDWLIQNGPIIEERLFNHWKFIQSCPEFEVDDCVGCLNQQYDNTILCHNDKDLLQFPGSHYNYAKHVFTEIDNLKGQYNLYIQVLMGDNTDNIKGIPRIGKAIAPKILENCTSSIEYMLATLNAYYSHYKNTDLALKEFTLNYQLCKLQTEGFKTNLVQPYTQTVYEAEFEDVDYSSLLDEEL